MKKNYLLVCLMLLLGFGGYLQAQTKESNSLNDIDSIVSSDWIKGLKKTNSRRLTKHIMEQYADYEDITLKISAKLFFNEKHYKLNMQYKSIKDSIIWINLSHSSGLPVGRLLITKDSLKFIDRMKKKYYKIAYQNIRCDTLDYCLDYNIFSALLMGELINLNPKKRLLGAYSRYKSYKTERGYVMQNLPKRRLNRIIKKNKIERFFIHINQIDSTYKITENRLEDNENQQNLSVHYLSYDAENNVPKKMDIQFANPKDTVNVQMKIKRVKINTGKMKFSFRVPKKYEVIE